MPVTILTALDSERQAGTVKGPLHGISFTLKDNITTTDNMETTAGSYAILGNIVPRDAHVLSRLRAAGGKRVWQSCSERMGRHEILQLF